MSAHMDAYYYIQVEWKQVCEQFHYIELVLEHFVSQYTL